jgi:hypothetical protein
MKRSRVTGFVYIAGSIIKNYIKIGMTTEDPEKRIIKLNSRKVGNTNDWIVIKAVKCDYVNKVEKGIQQELIRYKVEGIIYDDNTESSEIYRCKYDKANETLETYFADKKITKLGNKSYLANPDKFNTFRNIANPKHQ